MKTANTLPEQATIEGLFKFKEELSTYISLNDNKSLIKKFTYTIFASGGLYGFIMGIQHSFYQALSSALKVPLLFFITLLICIPTLHFSGLILGSRLKLLQSLSILLWGIAINCILLAAFAPITLFFMFSHSSYEFIMFLHVTIFIVCGIVGLRYIGKNFAFISKSADELDNPENNNKITLFIWMILYMFVGTQMAYIMSPFVGRDSSFILFTGGDYNFYTYLLHLIR
jgi:hypothetical protein